MRHYTIPVFIPELACPNRCVFCNQSRITGSSRQPSANEIRETVMRNLETIPAGNHIEIGFFGGSFTGIELSLQESYLALAQEFVDGGLINGIRLSTRPDYINREVMELLSRYSVASVELGAQSLDEEVLVMAGRGHSVKDVVRASEMIIAGGIELGLQMMIGLPGDTREKSLNTARMIVELGAGNTRIYPTLVIRDTDLENMYRQGTYVPLTLEEAVERTSELVGVFEAADVKILRMGLHPSEGLLSGENLVAGPFHVAFGEMVMSAVWRELFRTEIENFKSGNEKHTSLIIEVPPGQINMAVGHKASNRKFLQQYINKVGFRENAQLSGRAFRFNWD